MRHDRQRLDQQIKRDTHETRWWLILYIVCVTLAWLIFTACVILLDGYQCNHFDLSDTVMIAFLTTSLANILGLLGIGLNFYFPRRPHRHESQPSSTIA